MPKIEEVDRFLRTHSAAQRITREVHPEVLFWALNGGGQLVHKKKSTPGFQERLEILRRANPQTEEMISHALSRWKRSDVARDDILDALAAAVTAELGQDGFETIPEDPEIDDEGLPMEMVYVRLNHKASKSGCTETVITFYEA